MKILLIDDEKVITDLIEEFLENDYSLDITKSNNPNEALEMIKSNNFNLIISDIGMPNMDGFELFQQTKKIPFSELTDFVFMTGMTDIDLALNAVLLGAYDYISKPVKRKEILALVKRVKDHQDYLYQKHISDEETTKIYTEKAISDKLFKLQNILMTSNDIDEVGIFSSYFQSIIDIALKFHKDRNIPVLIHGETGTGKEIIAKIVHNGKSKKNLPFISINCAAIPENLFESELFGYAPGSFTGGSASGKIGKIELAEGGTLFLDEIGEMPLQLQAKLLRVIQEKEYYQVGGIKTKKTNVRFIAATNKDLENYIKENKFREDLYFRLNIGNIKLKPLRQRVNEISAFAKFFLNKLSLKKGKSFSLLTSEAIRLLENYNWPGNIRELKNVIERAVLINEVSILNENHFNFLMGEYHSDKVNQSSGFQPGALTLPERAFNIKELEKEIIMKALEKFNGNKTHTAKYLFLSRSALRSRIKSLGIE